MIEFFIKVKTISESNTFDHWTKKHKRKQNQKILTWDAFKPHLNKVTLPCTVHMTRISPRTMDDDNLRGCLKTIRDSIASMIFPDKAPGRADDNPLITWKYHQQKGSPQQVRIRISEQE